MYMRFPPLDGTLLQWPVEELPSAHEHKHEAYLTANSHSSSKPINLDILQRNAEVMMCNTRPQVPPLFRTLETLKMNPATAAGSSDLTITLHSRHSVGRRNFKKTRMSWAPGSTLRIPFTDSGGLSTQILHITSKSPACEMLLM